MRISWGSIVTAGITASVAVILFLFLIPQIMGMGVIDITSDLGGAFSTQSPHVAGAVFLAMYGIFWAIVFSAVYNRLPGTYLTKGMIFGLMVGLISLAVLPGIMGMLNGIISPQITYEASASAMNIQAMLTLIAYMVFGLVLSWSYRPSEA